MTIDKSNSNLFLSIICAVSVWFIPNHYLKTVIGLAGISLYIKSEQQLVEVKDNPQRQIFEAANRV